MKKYLPRLLSLMLTALILGLSFYRWNAATLGGNQMPMPFGIGISTVLSGSMEPAIPVGALAIVRQSEDIQPGDIVVYQSDSMLVLHRVVQRQGDTLITRGDANNAPDPAILMNSVKGELVAAIPHLGRLVNFCRRPGVVVFLLAGLVFSGEWSYRKERKEKEADLQLLEAEIRSLSEELKEKYKH